MQNVLYHYTISKTNNYKILNLTGDNKVVIKVYMYNNTFRRIVSACVHVFSLGVGVLDEKSCCFFSFP